MYENLVIVDYVIEDFLNDTDIQNKIIEIFSNLAVSYTSDVTFGVRVFNNFTQEVYLILNKLDETEDFKKININNSNVICEQKFNEFIESLK